MSETMNTTNPEESAKSPSQNAFSNTDSFFAIGILDAAQDSGEHRSGAYKEIREHSSAAATQRCAKSPSQKTNWLKLLDYGSYPHALGLQRFTFVAAQNLVKLHRSLYGRLRRYFGGIPVYIGHPDDPTYRSDITHSDSRAYAWVHEVEARADGLWIKPIWSERGGELLENAHYKFFSPRWRVKRLDDGSFEPVELISIGLTNNPNIHAPAISNSADYPAQNQSASEIAAVLGLDGATEVKLLAEKVAALKTALAEALEKASSQAAPEAPSQPTEPNFMSNTLANYTTTRAAAKERFLADVHARIAATGEDFSSAWSNIKQARREIFNKI